MDEEDVEINSLEEFEKEFIEIYQGRFSLLVKRESGMKFSKLTKPELEEIVQNANFTDEEEEIFRLLARGYSLKEISFRLSICLSTLCRRISAIKNKVNRLDVIL